MMDRYLVPGTTIVILLALGAYFAGLYVHTHSSPICVNWVGVYMALIATFVVGTGTLPLGISAYSKKSWSLGGGAVLVALLAGLMWLGAVTLAAMCGGV
jgi:hypothetical protein